MLAVLLLVIGGDTVVGTDTAENLLKRTLGEVSFLQETEKQALQQTEGLSAGAEGSANLQDQAALVEQVRSQAGKIQELQGKIQELQEQLAVAKMGTPCDAKAGAQ